MREFLIKYYVGRYWWKFPWMEHYFSTNRASFWNFNGYLLLALIFIISGGKADWVLLWPVIIWSAWVLYISFPLVGFAYFEKYPFRWEELDLEQKWMYGQAAQSGELTKKLIFHQGHFEEWLVIARYFKKKYNLK